MGGETKVIMSTTKSDVATQLWSEDLWRKMSPKCNDRKCINYFFLQLCRTQTHTRTCTHAHTHFFFSLSFFFTHISMHTHFPSLFFPLTHTSTQFYYLTFMYTEKTLALTNTREREWVTIQIVWLSDFCFRSSFWLRIENEICSFLSCVREGGAYRKW